MNNNKKLSKLELFIYLIIAVAVIGAFLGIPTYITNIIIEWLIGAFIGTLFSIVAGAIVEAFTGDILKTLTLTIEIKGIEFSITVFAIATFIVKVWLFGL